MSKLIPSLNTKENEGKEEAGQEIINSQKNMK